jgi:hypothetical protein
VSKEARPHPSTPALDYAQSVAGWRPEPVEGGQPASFDRLRMLVAELRMLVAELRMLVAELRMLVAELRMLVAELRTLVAELRTLVAAFRMLVGRAPRKATSAL